MKGTMTGDDDAGTGPTTTTRAQAWAVHAHELIESEGQAGLSTVLDEGFVHESRRGEHFNLDRPHLLDTVKTMRSLGMHVSGRTVAVAGDLCVLTHRRYDRRGSVAMELLAVSVWDDAGRLHRLVEFDVDDLDAALAMLAEVSGEPVVRLAADA